MSEYFAEKDLLKAPTNRAAFSDRTAYVMAEMSRLAYFKFEGGNSISDFLADAKKIVKDEKVLGLLQISAQKFMPNVSAADARDAFSTILDQGGYTLVDTFNKNGCQAFLCKHKERPLAILAFRGTEVNYTDIKTDISAKLKSVKMDGKDVLVHSGYWSQFESVKDAIKIKLGEVKDAQLFITGHSLGGALATVAVKCFSGDASGACYTFGAPPVSTKTFADDIKTPIYRIVNHLDIVPNLPNPFIVMVVTSLWKIVMWVLAMFQVRHVITSSKWKAKLEQLLADAARYRQVGYKSYLTGTDANPKLRRSLGVWDAVCMWVRALNPIKWFSKNSKAKRLATDHSIAAYSNKLRAWAVSRSKPQPQSQ